MHDGRRDGSQSEGMGTLRMGAYEDGLTKENIKKEKENEK